jgi:hypothetical protein
VKFTLTLYLLLSGYHLFGQQHYSLYHQQVISIEEQIVDGNYAEALKGYDEINASYSFLFIRDIKVAAQLALFLNDNKSAISWLKKGMDQGWTWKKIKKLEIIDRLGEGDQKLLSEYPSNEKIQNEELRERVRDMIRKDQSMAFRALLRLTESQKNAYTTKKFAPHSEIQMAEMHRILDTYGYPGERLIAENIWASTIICHHNSMGTEYAQSDTLFTALYPKLMKAFDRGEVSPFELAIMLDWRTSMLRDECGLGFLTDVTTASLACSDQRRRSVGLRSVETRNALYQLQSEMDIDFVLLGGPWVDGEIEIKQD